MLAYKRDHRSYRAIFGPIKRACKVLAPHARDDNFPDYGDEQDFCRKLEKLRTALAREEIGQDAPNKPNP